KVAAVIAGGLVVLQRIDSVGCSLSSSAKSLVAGRLSVERLFRFRNTARMRLGATYAHAGISDLAPTPPGSDERRTHGEIAGAAAEFLEAEFGPVRQQRQARFCKQFVLAQHRRHDAFEEFPGRDDALALGALRNQLGIEGRRDKAPFRSRIG